VCDKLGRDALQAGERVGRPRRSDNTCGRHGALAPVVLNGPNNRRSTPVGRHTRWSSHPLPKRAVWRGSAGIELRHGLQHARSAARNSRSPYVSDAGNSRHLPPVFLQHAKPYRVSALLTHPCCRTLPASSRAPLLCVTLVPCAVCSLPTYNMRTCNAFFPTSAAREALGTHGHGHALLGRQLC
jgi:hypothetical protein